MSERYDEALSELHAVVNELHHESEQCIYGYFHGGDPNDFSPDPECSTEAEREAHRLACQQWNAGNKTELPGPHEPLTDADGKVIGHLTRSGFGLGTNVHVDERARDWAERLERILNRLEDERP